MAQGENKSLVVVGTDDLVSQENEVRPDQQEIRTRVEKTKDTYRKT